MALVVVPLVALAACSGGSSSTAPKATTAVSGETVTKPAPKTVDGKPLTTINALGKNADAILARLGCKAIPPDPDVTDVQVGPKRVDDQSCMFEGHVVEVQTYPLAANVAAIVALSEGINSPGERTDLATGPGWVAYVYSDAQHPIPDATSINLADDMARLLGGTATHYVAPAK